MPFLQFCRLSSFPSRLTRCLFSGTLAVGILLFLLGCLCLLIPPETLVRALRPQLTRLFSPDGNISENTLALLISAIHHTTPLMLAGAAACFTFAWSGYTAFQRTELAPIPPAVPAPDIKELSLLTVIILAAMALRVPLMDRGLSYDELYSAVYHIQPCTLFGDDGRFLTSQHVGYTPFAIMTTTLFGLTEWALRLPALIFGIASIIITWGLGRQMVSRPVILLTTALLAVSPAHIAWSATARGYSGYLLCATTILLMALQTLRNPAAGRTTGFIALALAGYFFHSLSLLFLGTLAFFIVMITGIHHCTNTAFPAGLRRLWTILGMTLGTVILTCLPFIARTGVEHEAYPRTGLLLSFPVTLWNALVSIPWPALSLFAFVTLLLGLRALSSRNRHIAYLTILLLLMPLGMWLSRPSFMYERFWAGLVPLILLMIAGGIEWIHDRRLEGKVLAVLLTGAIMTGMLLSTLSSQAPMIRDSSWRFRDDAQHAARSVPMNIPVYALEGQERFFRFYLNRRVITLKNTDDYTRAITPPAPAAFLILPDFIRSASYAARPILDRLRAETRESTSGIVSIFTRE
jgi:hypothetical protein